MLQCCAISGWEGKNWGLLFSKGHVHRTNLQMDIDRDVLFPLLF